MNAHAQPGDGEPLEIPPIQSLEDFRAETLRMITPRFQSKFGALTLDRLDEPGPEHDWLIDGLFSIGDKSVLGGPSQSGKSFLAIHAGMCIAMGVDFFGFKVKPGLVIYQAGEGARGVKKRLRAWRQHFGVEFGARTPFVLLQGALDLYKSDDTPALIAEIKAIAAMYDVPLRAVFIDTMATASIGAEENSAKDMGLVMSNVDKINKETKAHCGLVHHMNAGADKLRGSTAIYANIDQTLFVKRNETTKVRTVILGKQRDDDSSVNFQFELLKVTLGHEANGREITSCVCLPVGEKEAIRRTEENKGYTLTDQNVLFMRALFDADKRYGQPVPAEMTGVPKDVRSIVSYDAVKRAYAALSPSDVVESEGEAPADPEAAKTRHREMLKKRLQRAREFLTTARVIGAERGLMWWTGKPLRAFPATLPREVAQEIPEGQAGDLEIPF